MLFALLGFLSLNGLAVNRHIETATSKEANAVNPMLPDTSPRARGCIAKAIGKTDYASK